MMTDYLASIHHAADGSKRLPRHRIARLDFQRFLEAAHRVAVHFFSKIRAAQIVMRKVAWLVAAGLGGAAPPPRRLLPPAAVAYIKAQASVRVVRKTSAGSRARVH